jgi:RNA polymerase sigma-70 factor (ECF subfamily)
VAADPAITILLGESEEAAPEAPLIPDERLKLLFVCAHPAIDAGVRTALMLQTVLGLDARQIASAFLVSPTTMAQRLVRAKAKIKQAGIRFEEPEAPDLPERIHGVLDAIYAAYGLGWDGLDPDALGLEQASNLVGEAIYLADLTASLLPASAEAAGLLALLLLCESRRAARHGPAGAFIPLHQQDCNLWDQEAIRQADQILWVAAAKRQPGPFQLEAAIQAAHCHRAFTGRIPWQGIARLYDQLVQMAPTTGAQVSRAVALAEAGSVPDGLAALNTLAAPAVASYQPYWVARAHLLALGGQFAEARACYQKALGLTTLRAVRSFLQQRLDLL